LNHLRHEHEIQTKIVLCAKKLLHDQAKGNSNLLDSVLKQRFEFYTCVKEKVNSIVFVFFEFDREFSFSLID
jgi:hypothetical protein